MKTKKIILLFLVLIALLFSSCDFDPEEAADTGSLKADVCEENDSFEDAFDEYNTQLIGVTHLNFFDDVTDYFLFDFDIGTTYTINANVLFDHLTDPYITIYDMTQKDIVTSSKDGDTKNAIISNFTAEESRYYVLVLNNFLSTTSGTGEYRAYQLLITEEE